MPTIIVVVWCRHHQCSVSVSGNGVSQGALYCPSCNAHIATRYITKMDKKEAYRFVPSAFNKKHK
ncbi:MAG: hypothetical protein FWD27_05065 [Coriobacteriia bacterium]|nr:hypothetical protein [Coriobacteriia bacterium]